ncbi:sensor histidine kinase [Bacteroides sp. 519]|uniref:sensor histidine kinase n=1 Tax=Bacteroides sp. 519 TaxID=2302937 RepID=UPI00194035A5|nr:histidine kinase [Bacteroides sp. 519]
MKKVERLFINFILSPRYRVQRHLAFILVLAILSTDLVVNIPNFGSELTISIISIALYNIFIIGTQYLNAMVAVPHLLLKNKYLYYILFIAAMILLIIGVLIFIQANYYSLFDGISKIANRFLLINILSSISIISLLFAGITTMMLFRYWLISSHRITELESATLQSELKYLRNQINPHFLFNTLNNAHALFKDKKKEASSMLYKLEDLLRYQINESSKDAIYLASDIQFLTDYLNLEKVRRDRFTFTIQVDGEIANIQLPPLLFIPFVENAVKHSQDSEHPSFVHLQFTIKENQLHFQCENSRPSDFSLQIKPGGIGLKNIRRRLELLFPGKYDLQLSEEETKYVVNLLIF